MLADRLPRARRVPDKTVGHGATTVTDGQPAASDQLAKPGGGTNVRANRVNDFPRQANGYGQTASDHASSRTDPDEAERRTGIYGSVRLGFRVPPSAPSSAALR